MPEPGPQTTDTKTPELSSSLDSIETTVPSPDPDSYRAAMLHDRYPEYSAAWTVYNRLDRYRTNPLAASLAGCRTWAIFVRHQETGKVRVQSNACHLRWCPLCSRTRQYIITQSVSEWLSTTHNPKFVTLTLKHTDAPLNHQISTLYKHFRILKKRKLIRRRISGGVWFFQITRSKADGLWHPHLHIVIDGGYIPQKYLARAWHKITLTSNIVHIEAVRDRKKAARYVAQYSARPTNLADKSPEELVEVVQSLYGRRLCGAFGSARGVQLRPTKQPDSDQWRKIGSWRFIRNLGRGNKIASLILQCYYTDKPLDSDISLQEFEMRAKNHSILPDNLTIDELNLLGEPP